MTKQSFTLRTLSGCAEDRSRRIVFIAALVGILCNFGLLGAYLVTDGPSVSLFSNSFAYTLALSVLVISSYTGRLFKLIVPATLIVFFAVLWVNSLTDLKTHETQILDLPILMAVPLCLVLVSRFRTLLTVAVVQSVCLFFYLPEYLRTSYGVDWPVDDQITYAASMSALSFVSLGMLACVAYLREQTDRRLEETLQKTEKLASEDPLTGLLNRRAFHELVRTRAESGLQTVIALIDLDRFKPLNDVHGHAVGDSVLCEVGKRLKSFDCSNACARMGGDEFAVLVTCDAQLMDIDSCFEHLHHAVCQPFASHVGLIDVRASIGYSVGIGHDAADLINAADTALMRAKSNGGGVAKFDENVDHYKSTCAVMETNFREALRLGQIKPALQPIVDAISREVVGYELLARWTNSGLDRNPSPVDFIPIAERLGLMNELSVHLLETTITGWEETRCFISVNVSTSQLGNYTFISQIKELLARHHIPTSSIQLEVTEAVSYRDVQANIETLHKAREDGFMIALDDFGTGYSSLAILDQLPLDKIKLDQSFVRRSTTGIMSHLLAATVDLANRLDLKCCVEGIEDGLTAYHVASLGCHELQGYYFGKPEIIVSDRAPQLAEAS